MRSSTSAYTPPEWSFRPHMVPHMHRICLHMRPKMPHMQPYAAPYAHIWAYAGIYAVIYAVENMETRCHNSYGYIYLSTSQCCVIMWLLLPLSCFINCACSQILCRHLTRCPPRSGSCFLLLTLPQPPKITPAGHLSHPQKNEK